MPQIESNLRYASPSVIRGFWDAWAPEWAIHEPIGPKVLTAVRRFTSERLDRVSGNNRFLDLCSGADYAAYYPSEITPAMVSAMDISPGMLALNSAGDKKVADVKDGIPYPENSFDAVTIFFGWSHLTYRNSRWETSYSRDNVYYLYKSVLGNISKVLQPNGLLLVVDAADAFMQSSGPREFHADELAIIASGIGFRYTSHGNIYHSEVPSGIYPGAIAETTIDYMSCHKAKK